MNTVHNRAFLRALVDHVWGVAHEDKSVPASDWADSMIDHVIAATGAAPEIKPEDIQISSYPPHGNGMHVGTAKGVIILHKSGLSVACGMKRSQHHNRDVAMRGLQAMLSEIQE